MLQNGCRASKVEVELSDTLIVPNSSAVPVLNLYATVRQGLRTTRGSICYNSAALNCSTGFLLNLTNHSQISILRTPWPCSSR